MILKYYPIKKNRGCKRKLDDELDREILKAFQDKTPPSFFTSVIPPIKHFSEDEKLEFRMGVIKLIQDIKLHRHRIWFHHFVILCTKCKKLLLHISLQLKDVTKTFWLLFVYVLYAFNAKKLIKLFFFVHIKK